MAPVSQAQFTITDLNDGPSLYTWVKYADDINGTNMSDSPTGKTYMGIAVNKTSSTESTTATDYTWSLFQGPQGNPGAAGKGISSVTEYYLATSASSGVTTATTGWTTTVQTITSTNKYLWNYEKITYTDSTTSNTTPVIIGVYGDTGGAGSAGKGISSITEYYLATSASSGVTTATAGWTTTIQTITTTNKYLWNYEKVTYTDSSTTNTTPVILGVYGDTGSQGNSYEIQYIRQQLAPATPSGNTPSGWSTTVPTSGYGNVWFAEGVKDASGNLVGSWSVPALYALYTSDLLANQKWTVGTGAVSNYGINGTSAENVREILDNPFGSKDVVWRTIDQDTTSDGEGGWNHTGIPIDHTKMYRVSVWAKQLSAAGGIFLGCAQSGTNNMNDTANNNPYFISSIDLPALNKWYLMVGYIYGSGATETTNHPLGGVYDGATGLKPISATSFKNLSGVTIQTHRAYQYYSTVVGTETQFYAPRFDLCDGNEPSIQDLLRTGTQGNPGAAGKGVTSIVEEYYLSTSSTAQAGGSWSTTVPTWVDGNYIWTRSTITYTDSTTATTTPVCVTGGKGSTGGTGKGITSVDVEYYLSTSNTTQTGGSWSTTAPAWVDGSYMWSRTKTVYTDATTVYSNPACITGAKGSTGGTGKGISSVTEYYLATSASSGVTTATAGWTTTVQSLTSTNKYLWNYEKITYTDSSTTTTTPVIIGVYGDTGGSGPAGKGISSVTEYYLATSASSGVTTATAGWVTTVPTITTTNKYLWNYEKITYTDSSTTTTTPVIIGVYGDTGGSGPRGPESDEALLFGKNSSFYDWTGVLPDNYSGQVGVAPTKVASDNKTSGNSVQWVVAAAANTYMQKTVTNVGYSQYLSVEVTFKLTSGTIGGAGVLVRLEATADSDTYIKFVDYVSSPVLNQWYTITEVIKLSSTTAPAGYAGYTIYPMGGYTAFGTIDAKTILFDAVKVRPATDGEKYGFENGLLVNGWVVTGTTEIDGGKIKTDSVTSREIYVADLSSLSANIGTITAGILKNTAGTTQLNLTTGTFTLGGTALTWNGTILDINGNIVSDSDNGSRVLRTTISDGALSQEWLANDGSYSFDIVMDAWNGTATTQYTTSAKTVIDKQISIGYDLIQFYSNNTANDTSYLGTIQVVGYGTRRVTGTTGDWVPSLTLNKLDIDMGNNNIYNANHITIADGGGGEGIEWLGSVDNWKIVQAPDDLSNPTDGHGDLQFVRNGVRRATFKSTGILDLAGNTVSLSGTNGLISAEAGYLVLRSVAGGIVYGQGSEIRATTVNATSFTPVVCQGVITGYTNLYLQVGSTGEVIATSSDRTAWGSTVTYRPFRGSAFTVNSKRDTKTNISPVVDGALSKVINTKIYDYHLVDELNEYETIDVDNFLVGTKNPKDVKKRTGMILDEAPEEVVSGEGIDLYAMNSLLWKAVQELSEELAFIKKRFK